MGVGGGGEGGGGGDGGGALVVVVMVVVEEAAVEAAVSDGSEMVGGAVVGTWDGLGSEQEGLLEVDVELTAVGLQHVTPVALAEGDLEGYGVKR